jgi:hypothetical protein
MAATWQSVELVSGSAHIPIAPVVSPWIDFTAAYEGYIVASAVNHVSTAPSLGTTVFCDISGGGDTTYLGAGGLVQSGSGAGTTFSWQFQGLEGSIARVNYSGVQGSSVNCFAVGKRLTGI